MEYLSPVDLGSATDEAKPLLERVRREMGMVPTVLRVVSNSPKVLEGYLAIQERLEAGELGSQLKHQIALAVSQAHGSAYCVSAYTALGRAAGLGDQALRDARTASSPDRKTDVAVKFALALAARSDVPTGRHLARLRAVGFGDAEVVEIVAHVMLVQLLNAVCELSDPPLDFPSVAVDEVEP